MLASLQAPLWSIQAVSACYSRPRKPTKNAASTPPVAKSSVAVKPGERDRVVKRALLAPGFTCPSVGF